MSTIHFDVDLSRDLIVGLNGNKGAGKDTVGSHLVRYYGFERISYAAAMKQSVAQLFGISLEDIEIWKNVEDVTVQIVHPTTGAIVKMSFRKFLQNYGTEAHRQVPAFGDDVWLKCLWATLPVSEEPKRYVVTDARFENELKDVRKRGGYTWRIERPEVEDGDGHASEAKPDPALIDTYLRNDATIADLEAAVDFVMQDAYGIEPV